MRSMYSMYSMYLTSRPHGRSEMHGRRRPDRSGRATGETRPMGVPRLACLACLACLAPPDTCQAWAPRWASWFACFAWIRRRTSPEKPEAWLPAPNSEGAGTAIADYCKHQWQHASLPNPECRHRTASARCARSARPSSPPSKHRKARRLRQKVTKATKSQSRASKPFETRWSESSRALFPSLASVRRSGFPLSSVSARLSSGRDAG
jgi:hypothetical protein